MEFTNKSILQRQYVSFDIDTNELIKYYPEDNWRKAYDDIRKHMQNHGFEWIQGSGYISTKPMATIKAHKTVKEFIQHNQWINKCMRDCRVFDVGKTNDLNVLFDKTVEVPIRTGYQEENKDYQKNIIRS